MKISTEVQDLDKSALVAGRTIEAWLKLAAWHQPQKELDIELLTELIRHYGYMDTLRELAAATLTENLELLENLEREMGRDAE